MNALFLSFFSIYELFSIYEERCTLVSMLIGAATLINPGPLKFEFNSAHKLKLEAMSMGTPAKQ